MARKYRNSETLKYLFHSKINQIGHLVLQHALTRLLRFVLLIASGQITYSCPNGSTKHIHILSGFRQVFCVHLIDLYINFIENKLFSRFNLY